MAANLDVSDHECSDSTFIENSLSEEAETEEDSWTDDECVEQSREVDNSYMLSSEDMPAPAINKDVGNKSGENKRKQTNEADESGIKHKKARNTTHASKVQCLDHTEIRDFVRRPPCCCKKKCLQKLKIFADRAEKAVNQIRVSRFNGAITIAVYRSTIKLTPGVKIIS